MTTNFSSESANWILPSNPTTFTSTLPNYEQATPFRVNREGVKNYIKNRGSLNIGDWAIEGRRMSTSTITSNDQESTLPQPKVIGDDALRNYTKSRCTTPNLIYGNLSAPDTQPGMRVKREGRANYEKNHNSEAQTLLQNYGKLPLSAQPAPNTQGEVATNLFYTHQEGKMGSLLNNYGHHQASPRRIPHVKGTAAEVNREKGLGDSQLFDHRVRSRLSTPEPHLKGTQAQTNYDMGQGRHVNELFHQYGKLKESTQAVPKVKYDGIQNLIKGQGDDMRKTLSQCPPTNRPRERLQSVTVWP